MVRSALLPAKEKRLARGRSHHLVPSLMKNLYLDELAVGGGEGTDMLGRIKKAAVRLGPSAR